MFQHDLTFSFCKVNAILTVDDFSTGYIVTQFAGNSNLPILELNNTIYFCWNCHDEIHLIRLFMILSKKLSGKNETY